MNRKQIISLLLALVMLLDAIPIRAMAAEVNTDSITSAEASTPSEVLLIEDKPTEENVTESDNTPLIITESNEYNCSTGSSITISLKYTYGKKWDYLTWRTVSGGTAYVEDFTYVEPGKGNNSTADTWQIILQVKNDGEEDSVIIGTFSVDGQDYQVTYSIHNVLVVPITQPELLLSQKTYSCGVNDPVTVTVNYKYSKKWDSMEWHCSTDGAVVFGEEMVVAPGDGGTNTENMWWISIPVTALAAGKYTITVSTKAGEKECSAEIILKVEDANPLSFAEESYVCFQSGTIGITAIYNSAEPWDSISWECSNLNSVELSQTSSVAPGTGGTGLENIWWLSVQATGLKVGNHTITVTITKSGVQYRTTTTLIVMDIPILSLYIGSDSSYTSQSCKVGNTVSAKFTYRGSVKWDLIDWGLNTSNGARIENAEIQAPSNTSDAWYVNFNIKGLIAGEYTLTVSVLVAGETFTISKQLTVYESLYSGTIDYGENWTYSIADSYYDQFHQYHESGRYYIISGKALHASSSVWTSSSIGNSSGKQSVFYVLDGNGDIKKMVAFEDALTPEISAGTTDSFVYSNGEWMTESFTLKITVSWKVNPEGRLTYGTLAQRRQYTIKELALSTDSNAIHFGKTDGLFSSKIKDTAVEDFAFALGSARTFDYTVYVDENYKPKQIAETAEISTAVTSFGNKITTGESLIVNLGNADLQKKQAEEKQKAEDEAKGAYAIADRLKGIKDKTVCANDPNLKSWFDETQYSLIQDYLLLYMGEVVIYSQSNIGEILDFVDEEVQSRIMTKLNAENAAEEILDLTIGSTYASTSVYATSVKGEKVKVNFEFQIFMASQKDKSPYGAQAKITYTIDAKKPNGAALKSGKTIITYVDFEAFGDVVIDYVKKAYMEIYGNFADKVAAFLVSTPFNKAIGGKYSERVYDLTAAALKKGITTVYAHCPVDMYVYDCSGNLCGAIINDKVVDGYPDILMSVHGDAKTAYLSGSDHYIELVGNDTGTMSYVIQEYDDSGLVRTVSTYDIPLNAGKTYQAYVPGIQGIDPGVLVLEGDAGEVIYANEDSDGRIIQTQYQPVRVLKTETCGQDACWTLYSDGVLEISGTGAFADGYNRPSYGYMYRDKIRKVVIQEGITEIGENAFPDLPKLMIVKLADSVTAVANQAFNGCDRLAYVYIGAGLKNGAAFYNCSSIQAYYVSEDNPSLRTIDDALYSKDGTILYRFPHNSVSSYTIPNTVTSIENDAFRGCDKLQQIIIPKSVTSVGYRSFDGCSLLKTAGPLGTDANIQFGWEETIPANAFSYTEITDIVLPEGLTKIGSNAFYLCGNLRQVIIPKTVTSMGSDVFEGCTKLTTAGPVGTDASIQFSWEETIPAYAFYRAEITEIALPDGLKAIGDSAFYNCSLLEQVIIPKSVTSMGSNVFWGCAKLTTAGPVGTDAKLQYSWEDDLPANSFYGAWITEAVLPEGLQSIGEEAFYSCQKLEKIKIPGSVISHGNNAFSGCVQLKTAGPVGTDVNIQLGWDKNIPDKAFSNTSIISIVIPDGISTIGNHAFSSCGALEKVIIPKTVTSMGEFVFWKCDKLKTAGPAGTDANIEYHWEDRIPNNAFYFSSITEIMIPESVKQIGDFSFYCSDITSVTLPQSLTALGNYAFSGCKLSEITILDGVTHIPDGVFSNCHKLASVQLPDSLTGIGSDAFSSCYCLEEITIPDGVTHIPDGMLSNCQKLVSVRLPERLKGIGSDAFSSCYSLKEITIPDSVEEIGSWAFLSCSSLSHISLPESLDILKSAVFQNCESLTEITLPVSISRIESSLLSGCTALREISLPGCVEYIGSEAFNGCINLQDVYYNNTPSYWMNVEIKEDGNDCLKNAVIHYSDEIQPLKCGKGVFWLLSEDGVLTISGKGAMYDFKMSDAEDKYSYKSPWYARRWEIKAINVSEGITHIGNYAFKHCENAISLTVAGTVETIGMQAFTGCTGLLNVDLCDGIISIGAGAFESCSSLEQLNLPDSITSISGCAFEGCRSLTSISWPEASVSIGDSTFAYCTSLASISLPDSIVSIGEYAFEKCSSLKEITLPNNVTSIGNYAFINCGELNTVILPQSLDTLGIYVFLDCYSIDELIFQGSAPWVDGIHTSIFSAGADGTAYYPKDDPSWTVEVMKSYGGELTWLPGTPEDYPETPTEPAENMCGEAAYWSLEEGVLTITGTGAMDDFDYAWNICPWYEERDKIQSVAISEGITHIGSYAFWDCANLTDISISGTVASIAEVAFQNCPSLSAVTIPDGVKTLGYSVFSGCTSLTSVKLSNQLTSIGENAFYDCAALKGITFPENITEIGENAFYGCMALKDIVFLGDAPAVTGLNNLEIFHYDLITVAYYPKGNTTWNHNVEKSYGGYITWLAGGPDELPSGFCGENITWNLNENGHLKISGTGRMEDYDNFGRNPAPWKTFTDRILEITVSDGITHIGDYSFYECTAAEKISIGAGICTIGDSSFEECSSIKALVLPEGLESIGYSAFSDCTNLTVIDIPATVTHIGTSAFNSCKNIREIVIPDGVEEIQAWTFQYCNYLRNITFPDDLKTIGIGAFWRCQNLQNIEIPASVTEIGEGAFYDTSPSRVIFWGTAPAVELVNYDSVFGTAYSMMYYPVNDTSWTDTTKATYGPNLNWIAFDAQATDQGSCGDSVKWEFNSETGTLRIYGTGKMQDYQNSTGEYGSYNYPWLLKTDQIRQIMIEDGVTSVGTYAFAGCDNVEQVTIPASVEAIGQSAFMSCKSVESVHISDLDAWLAVDFQYAPSNPLYYGSGKLFLNGATVEEVVIPSGTVALEEATFAGCSSIKRIHIPETVISINETFWSCSNLEAVYIEDLTKWCALDFADYSCNPMINGHGVQLYVKGRLVEELVIPDTVTQIGNYAFVNCSSITRVSFPEGLTEIGASAFMDCSSLTQIHLPTSLNAIGSGAFIGCSELEEVHMANLRDWFEITFEYADANPLYEQASLYVNGAAVTSLIVPVDIQVLPDYTLSGYGALQNISMHDDIVKIGEGALLECDGLTSLAIPENISDIGMYALRGCSNLQNVTFNGTLAVIPNYMFADCTSLMTVVLPDGIKEIGAGSFAGCVELQNVDIPESVTQIGSRAFASCKKLQCVVLPANLEILGSGAFHLCTELINIAIPETVRNIGSTAFSGCRSLTEISIPKNVMDIENYTFENCTALKIVHFSGNAPGIGRYAFRNVVADAYYPKNNDTWTSDVLQNYGGVLNWQPISCSDGHKEIIDEGLAPSCGQAGLTEGSHCAVCGEILQVQELIPPTEIHSYGIPIFTWNDEYSCTAIFACQNCSKQHSIVCTVTVQILPAEDGNVAQTVYTAEAVLGENRYTDTKTVVTPEVEDHTHTATNQWYSDDNSHWKLCVECSEKMDVAAHISGPEATQNTAQRCTVCNCILQIPQGLEWFMDRTNDPDSYLWASGSYAKIMDQYGNFLK